MSQHDNTGAGVPSHGWTVASGAAFIRRTGGRGGHMRRGRRGFTLLEMMLVVAIVGVLAMIASSQYAKYIDEVNVGKAKADILEISLQIERFYTAHFALPASLGEIGWQKSDPWDNPYHYTLLDGANKGKARKDRKLNPLNSDFDLFSAGKNGVFKSQITQKDSVDDVIRARNGSFVDLASKF